MTDEPTADGRLYTFTNDGLTFDVIDEGPLDGQVMVVLHGFPDRAANLRPMIAALNAAGVRVLAPDQRGYSPGARPKGVRPYAMDKLSSDILALADQAHLATFHVLGHDWGAAVAWELAAAHPERVMTMTALSVPHPRAFFAAMPRGQLLRSWYMIAFQLPWLPERILRLLFEIRRFADRRGTADRPPTARDGVVEFWRDPGAATAALNWYRAMLHRTSPPARVQVPALYVWSTGDPMIGRAAAESTGNWVDGRYRFEVLDGVSHWIPHDRPQEVAALVVTHLEDEAHLENAAQRVAGADGVGDHSCSI